MLIWIIILFSVISNAFFLGFRYARRIENKLDVPRAGKRHLYCLGDGITYGVGVLNNRRAYAWPYQLESSLGVRWQVINYGLEDAALLDGKNALQSGRTFQALSQVHEPSVLLMIGTNDSKLGIWNERRFEAAFDDFLARMTEHCQELIVLLPISVQAPKIPTKTEIRAEIVKQIVQIERSICQTRQIPFLDLFHLTENHPDWYANDGIHLNQQGNRKISDWIFEEIQHAGLLKGPEVLRETEPEVNV